MHEEKTSHKGLVLTLVPIAVLVIAAIVFLTSFKLESYTITGSLYYTEEELANMLFTEDTDRYAVLFALRINRFTPPQIPYIEKVDVELTDKNTAVIHVYDKAVTGCVFHMGQYFMFDREGIVVEADTVRNTEIPEIKGLSIDGIVLGKPLVTPNTSVFNTILDVLMLLQKNKLTAEDITFGIRYDVTLHIDGSEFLLGKDDAYDYRINNIPALMAASPEGSYIYDLRNYGEDNREVDARPIFK